MEHPQFSHPTNYNPSQGQPSLFNEVKVLAKEIALELGERASKALPKLALDLYVTANEVLYRFKK